MSKELEAAIDCAGREEVFRRARLAGWTHGAPPMVWFSICGQIIEEKDDE